MNKGGRNVWTPFHNSFSFGFKKLSIFSFIFLYDSPYLAEVQELNF